MPPVAGISQFCEAGRAGSDVWRHVGRPLTSCRARQDRESWWSQRIVGHVMHFDVRHASQWWCRGDKVIQECVHRPRWALDLSGHPRGVVFHPAG